MSITRPLNAPAEPSPGVHTPDYQYIIPSGFHFEWNMPEPSPNQQNYIPSEENLETNQPNPGKSEEKLIQN